MERIFKRLTVAFCACWAVVAGMRHDTIFCAIFSALFVYGTLLYLSEVIEGKQ
jgi:hypothetical protein